MKKKKKINNNIRGDRQILEEVCLDAMYSVSIKKERDRIFQETNIKMLELEKPIKNS